MTASPLLARPGAVSLEDMPPGRGTPAAGAFPVAAHYGQPLPEQRWAAEGAALVDRSNADVVAVPGPDRLSWLHSLTSQHLEQLADGTGTESLVLSPHGHVEHHLTLADLGGAVYADVEPGTGAALTAWLDRMRFMLRVEPALVTDAWALLSLVGPHGDDVLAAAGWPVPQAPYAVLPLDGGGFVRRMPPIGDGSAAVVDVLVPRAETAARADLLLDAGAVLAGLDAYEALRVEARRPRAGVDTDHRTIPNELPWLGTAVHLQKGCYRGQETVARVHNLGRPPRRQVLLHLDGVSEVLPAPGTPVTAGTRPGGVRGQGGATGGVRGQGGVTVGRIGTAVRHHELGVVALALVKQSVRQDAVLHAGEAVAAIDPDDAAPQAPDDTTAAARERVRAVRSATIGR
ncbi:folate-binding protein [Modestobacter sp. I12A-02628]|uniref:Folate-binding protein YgfZ n=1 Tax=Goekera deserti TaxID=2497753 RepID=A0A7K3WBH4_9ACTN|nr:folate-binding protein YgfZ [Goekera deserti]MPR00458.1 folate-binding protein [Goekera deserti]NDI49145.1 folate-binding protein [Goekera deserti]NEL52883.1 folate-binding protein YgfZ [Goekera deserti]